MCCFCPHVRQYHQGKVSQVILVTLLSPSVFLLPFLRQTKSILPKREEFTAPTEKVTTPTSSHQEILISFRKQTTPTSKQDQKQYSNVAAAAVF